MADEADILVDTREPKRIAERLSSKGLTVKREKLGVGDYVWGDTVIERKTLNDFLNSITSSGNKSPRIWTQAKGMSDNFEDSYVIISGTSIDIPYKKRYRPNMIYGTIAALQKGFDIKVNRVESETEFVKCVYSLWKRGEKGTTDRAYPSTPAKAPDYQRAENILCQIPQVGIKRARRTLKKHSNLRKIFMLSEEELEETMGKTGAKKLKGILDKDITYGDNDA